MHKYITVEFTEKELCFLNQLLLENAMQAAQLASLQPDETGMVRAINIAKTAASIHQAVFSNVVKGATEWPQPILDVIRDVVERSLPGIEEMKELAFKNGHPESLQLSDAHELGKEIIKKIPEPSKIIV